ncbi:hypothetical protein L4C39_19435 [Vibrio clamense]|uniref:hypothetical protein n=1 Tax=Vibrio clamense TaxID=2910254 RepID=UPI003D2603FF
MAEYALLNDVIDCMEKNGCTYKTVQLNIDEDLVNEINENNKKCFTLEQLQKGADKCLAHEWLKRTHLGGNHYFNLQITPKGVGAIRSKNRAEELKANRSMMKKISDYIEDHKGLFLMFGFLIAASTLALKFIGDK